MPDEEIQAQAKREESIAGGPVSAGALNTSEEPDGEILTSAETGIPSSEQDGHEDYDKLINSNASGTTLGSNMQAQGDGTPGGGSLPTESPDDSTRGGINTSSDTVSGASSSAGDVFGLGSSTGRGTMEDMDVDATTDTEDELDASSDAS